jgi:hypothetical protein
VGRWRSIVLAFSWVKAPTEIRCGEPLAENTEDARESMGPLTSTFTLALAIEVWLHTVRGLPADAAEATKGKNRLQNP